MLLLTISLESKMLLLTISLESKMLFLSNIWTLKLHQHKPRAVADKQQASVLSKYLAECASCDNDDHPSCPPARRLEDCIIVGKEDKSLLNGAAAGSAGGKRKRGGSDSVDTANTQPSHLDTSRTDTVTDASNRDPDQSTFEHAVQTFLSSGCCVIPNALPSIFVEECKTKATTDLELLNKELQCRRYEAVAGSETQTHKLASAYQVDYREMVDRDGLRRDVRFELNKWPFAAPGLVFNSKVFPVIKELLGGHNKFNLLYSGVMWARHCKPTDDADKRKSQKWHADGGHCFEHAHQPPHCINVFYPLIDLTAEHGPTEVRPGSHTLGKFDDSSLASFGLEAKAGDAILFDYRLKHRGGINISDQDRPILYLAYAKPWFRDAGNTRASTSIFANARRSPPWVSRLLTGEAMDATEGFENADTSNSSKATAEESDNKGTKDKSEQSRHGSAAEDCNAQGSGEQWMLFKMNIQLDGGREETIVVHSGDVAVEVSTQFCRQHQLSKDFIPILAETIQQQINQAQY